MTLSSELALYPLVFLKFASASFSYLVQVWILSGVFLKLSQTLRPHPLLKSRMLILFGFFAGRNVACVERKNETPRKMQEPHTARTSFHNSVARLLFSSFLTLSLPRFSPPKSLPPCRIHIWLTSLLSDPIMLDRTPCGFSTYSSLYHSLPLSVSVWLRSLSLSLALSRSLSLIPSLHINKVHPFICPLVPVPSFTRMFMVMLSL